MYLYLFSITHFYNLVINQIKEGSYILYQIKEGNYNSKNRFFF